MKKSLLLTLFGVCLTLGLIINLANLKGFDEGIGFSEGPFNSVDAPAAPAPTYPANPPIRGDEFVAVEPPVEPGPNFTLDINDGSHLVCSGSSNLAIPLKTQYGNVAIPLRLIQSIQFHKDRKTAVAHLLNKDRVTGSLGSQPLRVRTAIGEIAVPTNVILRLDIQRGDHLRDAPNWNESEPGPFRDAEPLPEPDFKATTIPRRAKTPQAPTNDNENSAF